MADRRYTGRTYIGGGAASGHSGKRHGGARRKRMRRRRFLVAAGGLLILGLLAGAVIFLFRSCAGTPAQNGSPITVNPATDTYRQGVTINGHDISGMTLEQARQTITPGIEYTIANIAITLQTEAFSERVTGEDMDAETDLEELLLTALQGEANQAYYTAVRFDYNALGSRISEINEGLTTGPTEASFQVEFSDSGKPTFNYIEGTPGYGLDVEATEALVQQALENNDLQAVLTPQLTSVQPQVTVEDVKAHTTLIGSFTTTYRAEGYDGLSEDEVEILANRSFNIAKAAGLINNTSVKPGKTWSFNDTVGDRTEERGWKLANAIIFGNQYTLEAGGGVCQVSTTLYNALLRANIEIVDRRKHSFPSDYVDKGLDATVDTGHIDFQFKNNSDYPLYIFAYITKNKSSNRKRDITVAVYGEALPEGVSYEARTELIEEIVPPEATLIQDKKLYIGEEQVYVSAKTGYIIDVYLDKYVNGKFDSTTFLYRDEYAAVQQQIKVGTKPTPTPEPTATPKPENTPDPQDQP